MESLPKKTIIATGAPGNVAFSTIAQCCRDKNLCNKFNIRAGCFYDSERASLLQEFGEICQCCRYDANIFNNDLVNAFKGADYAFLIPGRAQNRVQQMQNYVNACKQAGVNFVLLFSMLRPSGGTTPVWGKDYEQMENIVEESGLNYAFLRCTMQQQTLFLLSPDLVRRALPLPIGNGKVAMISTLDIGKVALKIFENPAIHFNRAYHLTGSELLGGHEMAKIASQSLNRDIRFINVTPNGAKKLLLDSGLEDWLCDEFLELFQNISQGRYEFCTSDLLQSLTGAKPITLSKFFESHFDRFTKSPEHKPVEAEPEGVKDVEQLLWKKGGKTQVVSGPVGVGGEITRKGQARGVMEKTLGMLQNWVAEEDDIISRIENMKQSEQQKFQSLMSHLDNLKDSEKNRLQNLCTAQEELSQNLVSEAAGR